MFDRASASVKIDVASLIAAVCFSPRADIQSLLDYANPDDAYPGFCPFGLMMMGCAEQRPAPPALASTDECYLNVSYVRDNELSRGVWEHIQTAQYDLIDSGDRAFGAAQWYSQGDGRAGFVYNLDCELARVRVQAVLEQFARRATSPDVAQALRDAKPSVREVTQAQFEDAEPL